MTAERARGGAPRGARRGRGLGRLGRGVRAAGDRPDDRGRARCARRTRTRSRRPRRGLLARFYADAHGLRVIHARAFNHSGPGQEPIYAIANFATPVRAGLDAGDDPVRSSPAAPTRAATSPTSATSSAPTGCSPRTASRASTTSAPASRRSARELIAALGEVAGVAVDHRDRPGQGPRPRGPWRSAAPTTASRRTAGSPRSRSSRPSRHPRLLAQTKGAWPL